MMKREIFFDTQQVPRIALILWIVYFFILALVDWGIISRASEVLLYYAVQAFYGFLILGVTLLPWRRLWSEEAVLPIVIVLMAILPTLTVHVMIRLAPSELLLSAEGMTLRLTPILLMGLLLTAWHYQWFHVLLFCLGIAGLNLAGILLLPASNLPLQPSFYDGLLVTGIEMISLLMVGFITSALVSRLRARQHDLAEANAQLRHRASIQEELTISHERNRMARELHDTLAHTLSALSVQLETAKAYWNIDPAATVDILDTSLAATRSGLQETRRALKALRASPLEDMGLSLALRQLAMESAKRANLQLNLSVPTHFPPLAQATEQCIYRVAQEATANVAHHANARTMAVQLTFNGDILLQVSDDGRGFDLQQEAKSGHFGLAGMRERAALVGGELTVTSQPGAGTIVRLMINPDGTPGL